MFIKYFIPEDGDEQAHPNVFKLESAQPTFTEIKKAFPVPGIYHFRFLKNVGSHIVWLDVSDDNSALPQYQGSIFIKVSRIAAVKSSSSAASSGSEFTPTSAQSQSSASAGAAASTTNSPPPVKAPKPALEKRASEKLIKFDEEVASPMSSNTSDLFASGPVPIIPVSAAASDGDLLGINLSPPISSNSQKSAASTPAASSDFFGLDTLKPTPAGAMSGGNSRSMSPMGPGSSMNPMAGGLGGGMNPMGGGMGHPQQQGGVMGGRGMPPMGGGMGRGAMGGGAAFDPFSNIGNMQGGRGSGPMGGRR